MASTPAEPDRLHLARLPTPLEAFDRIRDSWTVLVKRDDLTGSALSGNKARKLEYLFADARARGARRVLTCGGVQSNHCRATAVAATPVRHRHDGRASTDSRCRQRLVRHLS